MFRGLGRFGFLFFEVLEVIQLGVPVLVFEFVRVDFVAGADPGVERLGLGRLEFFEDVVGVDVLVVRIFRKGAGVCRRVPAVKQVTAARPALELLECGTKPWTHPERHRGVGL